MTVKMGAPMPPNPMMPRQPMNPLPPPMPVPPINPNMQFGQQPVGALPAAAGTFPVSANKRKRFGDSLETMLSRPPMVASDQMPNMNVFTGQMMNTAARRPVVQMRGGGIVRNMRRGGYSMADYSSPSFTSYTDSKKNTYAPTSGTPGKAVKTHDEIMASIRGGSSPNDDKPAPVVVVNTPPPDITGSFSDPSSREDYTPTAAELNQQLLDMGAPDKRFDVVPGAIKNIYGGMGNLDAADNYREELADLSAETAFDSQYPGSSTILPPETGGIAAIRSGQPIPDELSLQTPFNNIPSFPDELVTEPFNNANVTPTYLPDELITEPFNNVMTTLPDELITEPFNNANVTPVSLPDELTGVPFNNLGLGDTSLNPPERPVGGGQGGTGSGEEDDRGFIEKFKDDVKNFGSSLIKDLQMAADAGFFGGYGAMEKRLLEARNPDGSLKYTPDEVKDYIKRTKDTQQKQMDEQRRQSAQDDDGPMSTSVVDPCPPGMRLDPVAGICVPVEEAEEEGPSLSLNRTRDDEFSELDDIMNKIVKPIGDTDNVRTMQAGGSVGLNRAADNFLAAMGA